MTRSQIQTLIATTALAAFATLGANAQEAGNGQAQAKAHGAFVKDKRHGPWIEEFPDGRIERGNYRNGHRTGEWTIRQPNSDILHWGLYKGTYRGRGREPKTWTTTIGYDTGKSTGPMKNGKPHGIWTDRESGSITKVTFANGIYHGHFSHTVKKSRWNPGETFGGQFVDGKRQGHWGGLYGQQPHGGEYVDGRREGHWQLTKGRSGNYVNGKQEGRWHYPNGGGGDYINGKRRGQWDVTSADGDIESGIYVNGKKHGKWTEKTVYGSSRTHRNTGSYVNGKRHGDWTSYQQTLNGKFIE